MRFRTLKNEAGLHPDPLPEGEGKTSISSHQALGSSESTAVLGEERLQVRQALQSLATRSREVLVLRYYLDLPFDEIAEILGISASTARATASRGLTALTKKLEELR